MSEAKVQVKFMEELDSMERKRHEEVERGVLLRAAKVCLQLNLRRGCPRGLSTC